MIRFEGYERRIAQIEACMKEYGIADLEDAKAICTSKGIDVDAIVRGIQNICFENAIWAYTLGAAIAIKKGAKDAASAAEAIGIGLQAFCIPGSVADQRQVGLGHGNLGAMLLREETKCFCFLAGHESFAAAEGAIGIARTADKVRSESLKVILNGLGKDAAYVITRINGFTYVETEYNQYTGELKIVMEKPFSQGERAKIRCYGADDVNEGVAIMKAEGVDVSITGNSTNPTRFQHPVAGTYKKWAVENGVKYFSVASGGGTGRTLHPDNMAAGPASYGMTDTMGRMHSDAQFAGSSSVPAACGDDGPDRHGQQPHGWRHRCRGRSGSGSWLRERFHKVKRKKELKTRKECIPSAFLILMFWFHVFRKRGCAPPRAVSISCTNWLGRMESALARRKMVSRVGLRSPRSIILRWVLPMAAKPLRTSWERPLSSRNVRMMLPTTSASTMAIPLEPILWKKAGAYAYKYRHSVGKYASIQGKALNRSRGWSLEKPGMERRVEIGGGW